MVNYTMEPRIASLGSPISSNGQIGVVQVIGQCVDFLTTVFEIDSIRHIIIPFGVHIDLW